MTKPPPPDVLQINPARVCALIALVRGRNAQIGPAEGNAASNPSDKLSAGVLDSPPASDPVQEELDAFFEGLNVDERLDLVTLMWVGRGTYGLNEWAEARKVARTEATHSTADYLLGTPLLANYLEEGLAAFGLGCEDFDRVRR